MCIAAYLWQTPYTGTVAKVSRCCGQGEQVLLLLCILAGSLCSLLGWFFSCITSWWSSLCYPALTPCAGVVMYGYMSRYAIMCRLLVYVTLGVMSGVCYGCILIRDGVFYY